MRDLKQSYIQYLITKKQISKNTEDAYGRDINHFCGFLLNQGIDEITDVTSTTVNSYVLHMEKQQQSTATIHRRVAVIRGLFAYLCKRKIVEEDVTEFLTTPKIEKKSQIISSATVINQILLTMQGEKPKVLRDKSMLLLLYTMTMNVEDIIALQMEDVNLEMGYIRCNTAKRQQTFRCNKAVIDALKCYIKEGRSKYVKSDTGNLLFPNISGKKMSRQGFFKCVKTYARGAGVETMPSLRSIRMITDK